MIRLLLYLYMLLLLADFFVSLFPGIRPNDALFLLKRLTNYTIIPFKKRFGDIFKELPFDPSPLIIIVFIKLVIIFW